MAGWWFEDEEAYDRSRSLISAMLVDALDDAAGDDERDAAIREALERTVDRRLRSLFAAALADPEAKMSPAALVGWMLERVSPTGGFGDDG